MDGETVKLIITGAVGMIGGYLLKVFESRLQRKREDRTELIADLNALHLGVIEFSGICAGYAMDINQFVHEEHYDSDVLPAMSALSKIIIEKMSVLNSKVRRHAKEYAPEWIRVTDETENMFTIAAAVMFGRRPFIDLEMSVREIKDHCIVFLNSLEEKIANSR